MNTKNGENESKISYHAKYITAQQLNNFSPKNFAKLTQANLMSKVDFDNKLISFNRKITSNKTKILRSSKKQKKVLTAKDYNFFWGRNCFTSNDGSQNTFVYQPTLFIKCWKLKN